MLVVPSDHVHPPMRRLSAKLLAACWAPAGRAGTLVTFGCRAKPGRDRLPAICGFRTAPMGRTRPFAAASRGFSSRSPRPRGGVAHAWPKGRYLWNAGIFLFSVKSLIAAFEAHAGRPLWSNPPAAAVAGRGGAAIWASPRLDAAGLGGGDGRTSRVDYAVMEKATNLAVMPLSTHWSESRGAGRRSGQGEAARMRQAMSSPAMAAMPPRRRLPGYACLALGETEGCRTGWGIGLDNIVAGGCHEGCRDWWRGKDRAQDVKHAVAHLKRRACGCRRPIRFPADHRALGLVARALALGRAFPGRERIVVKPGCPRSRPAPQEPMSTGPNTGSWSRARRASRSMTL